MAEIHIVGELVSACLSQVPAHVHLFSRIKIEGADDDTWIALNEQTSSGCMQSFSSAGDSWEPYVWQLPIDLHYCLSTTHKWPRLQIEIYPHFANLVGTTVFAKGSCSIPFEAGKHELICQLARPEMEPIERLRFNILGDTSILSTTYCVPAGFTELQLNIIHRGLEENNVIT